MGMILHVAKTIRPSCRLHTASCYVSSQQWLSSKPLIPRTPVPANPLITDTRIALTTIATSIAYSTTTTTVAASKTMENVGAATEPLITKAVHGGPFLKTCLPHPMEVTDF